ncbi:hypothetical protein J3F83DRAFT_716467 [Trichoderma novae-zelandiae]
MKQEPPFTKGVYEGLVRPRSIIPWEVSYYRGRMVVSHGARTAKTFSTNFFMPAAKFGAVIIGNTKVAGVVGELLMQRLTRDKKLYQLPRSRLDYHAFPCDADSDEVDDRVAWVEAQVRAEARKPSLGAKSSEQQLMPLEAYAGEYWNPGWRGITVDVDA